MYIPIPILAVSVHFPRILISVVTHTVATKATTGFWPCVMPCVVAVTIAVFFWDDVDVQPRKGSPSATAAVVFAITVRLGQFPIPAHIAAVCGCSAGVIGWVTSAGPDSVKSPITIAIAIKISIALGRGRGTDTVAVAITAELSFVRTV